MITSTRPAGRGLRTATGVLAATAVALSGLVAGAPAAVAAVTCLPAQLCEAEAATLTGGAKLDTEHAGFTGSGFVGGIGGGSGATGTEGASIAFAATAAAAGQHAVTIRYANGGDRTRTMTLVVNGTGVRVQLLRTGSWKTWSTVTVPVTLGAGANALDLRVNAGNDGQVNIDSIQVDAAQPCALGQPCEAESALLSGGAGLANNHGGYTGTGFVEGMGAGSGISLSAAAPTAGAHEVVVRYANSVGGDGADKTRTMTLTVNGTDVPVQLPSTGAWNAWRTVVVPVTLTAGTNALKLHVAAGNDGNVNVDNLVVNAVGGDDGGGDDGGAVERGVTLRLFDIGFGLQKLCELKPGQTPNIDVLRPTINWSTPTDWAGMTVNYQAQVVADLEVPTGGAYTFRLTSDDGSRLSIDDQPVVDHDGLHGATAKTGAVTLTAGSHDLEIDYFQAGFGAELKLEWQRPGQSAFELVPTSVLSVESGGARVVAPGVKECTGLAEGPGDGLPLAGVHPSFSLSNLRPDAGFQPDVSGMAWYPNGDLAVLTWGKDQVSTAGKLYRVSGVQGAVDLSKVKYTEIASGLREPQGVAIVDDEVYVATKVGIDKLVDAAGDGVFETSTRLATWPNGNNFHEFAFGLPYRDGFFYVALSVALERSGNSVVPQPAPDRGTMLKISKDTGAIEYVAGGLRTPNGLGFGPEGMLLVTDNQGGWVPASKLLQIKQGAFYNHPTTFRNAEGQLQNGRFDDQPVTQPLVWMPHNEIANAPSTPVLMQKGPFAGQLAIGDVTYGGLQRVFLEQVGGQYQGALYRMTQGLEAGVNELSLGPDGDLYIGGIGYDGNWNQPGKLRYGLQKLTANDTATMDILRTEITPAGFDLTYTKPLSDETAQGLAARYELEQWRYNPTSQYGGPKIDQEGLTVSAATLSADRKTVSLTVEGRKPGRVVHITSPRPFSAADGQALWSTEVWYTANVVPGYVAPPDLGYYEAEEAALIGGAGVATEHSNYSGSGFADGFGNQGAALTFTVNAAAAGVQPVHLRYANGPNPFEGPKKVSLYVNGVEQPQWTLPSTGTWKTWATITRELDLKAGSNTISLRYEAGDDGNVNFDALRVGATADICTPAAVEAGYTGLFDGTLASLASWRMSGPGSFGRQADCSLKGEGGLGLLWHTGKAFTDYTLKLDWKLVKDDNGGVFIGFPDPANDPFNAVNKGYEIQIDATDDADSTTGAVYNFQGADAAKVAAALKPVGTWNSYDIEVAGEVVKISLNGVLVNTFTSTDPARDLAGFVGVQTHGAGETVFYRNIRVKDTKPSDTTAPTTTASTSPATADGAAGWYRTPVVVTLTGTDAPASAVTTEYRTGDGAWTAYTGPITVSTDGTSVLAYRSKDAAGNVEAEQSLTVKLDRTGPATVVSTDPAAAEASGWYTSTVVVDLASTDAASGVASTEYKLDAAAWTTYGGRFSVRGDGQHVLLVRTTDVAGNVTESTRTIKLDGSAPALTVTGVLDGGSYGDSGTRTVGWTATDATSAIAGTTATLDGRAVASGTVLRLWELPLGEHVLTVTGTNGAGTRTTVSRTFTTTTSLDDLWAHVNRSQSEGELTAKSAKALTDLLDKAAVAAAKGRPRDAAKSVADFLALVRDTKKTVTDSTTRALLVRDGEAVRVRYLG